MTTRPQANAGGAFLLSLVALTVLAGGLTDRMQPARERDAAWQDHLRLVDGALAANDASAAVRAWRDAYGAALASRRWDAMVEIGHAAIRIGEAPRSGATPASVARHAYLVALFRARDAASLEGLRRVAEAFAALGDREVAAQGLRLADLVATRATPGLAAATPAW